MLIEKSYKQYAYTSRYNSVPYYYDTDQEKYVYGISSYLDDSTPYMMHTVEQGDTLDNLALKYYSNPTLYWVICSYNRITNPYTELVAGQKLKIPSLSTIRFDTTGRT